ncbi:MAG TPA: DUF3137 domain-containing protein [Armatimonadota bacterium]
MTTEKPLDVAADSALTAEVIPHLETERAEAARAFYLAFGVFVMTAGAVALAVITYPYDLVPAGIAGALGIAAFIYCLWAAFSRQNDFAGVFSRWQDEQVMRSLDPDCDFDAARYLESAEYELSGLFPDEYNGFSGANYVHRKVGETEMAASNLNVTYTWETTRTESYTDSNGNTQTRTVTESHTDTRFSGLLLRFDAAKDFTGRVFIDPRRQSSRREGTTEVLLPSSEFMGRFSVSATDEFAAHYLLSPATLERILALQARFNDPIHLSYVESCLYLGLPGVELGFGDAPGLFRRVREESVLRVVSQCRASLLFLDGLVEQLDLNTRIWTKQ